MGWDYLFDGLTNFQDLVGARLLIHALLFRGCYINIEPYVSRGIDRELEEMNSARVASRGCSWGSSIHSWVGNGLALTTDDCVKRDERMMPRREEQLERYSRLQNA